MQTTARSLTFALFNHIRTYCINTNAADDCPVDQPMLSEASRLCSMCQHFDVRALLLAAEAAPYEPNTDTLRKGVV